MRIRTRKYIWLGVVFIALLFLVSSASAMTFTGKKSPSMNFTGKKYPFSLANATLTPADCSRDETELKYYYEEGLSIACDACGPSVWKSAIRLTQDEMQPYHDWTLTKVTVAFPAEEYCPSIDVKIYVYDKNTSFRPGNVIEITPTYTLNTPGITAISLPMPLPLISLEEMWVAVEWYDVGYGPYAWLDTITGPHVPQKGDLYYLNNAWGEIYTGGAEYDGNWGIGAIIEGADLAELSIGNIKGPMGIKANVTNVGENIANNVQWSIAVTGGLLKRVNALASGTEVTLAPAVAAPISLGTFLGFGKISIVITAKAENAPNVSTYRTAFLVGPFVLHIK